MSIELVESLAKGSKDDTVRRIFFIIMEEVISNRVNDDPFLAEFKSRIEPTTGISNKILLFRAMLDFKDPSGRIALTTAIPIEDRDMLATCFQSEFKAVNPADTRSVVGIILNPRVNRRFHYRLPNLFERAMDHQQSQLRIEFDDFQSVCQATAEVQAIIDNLDMLGKGDSLLTRGQFNWLAEKYSEWLPHGENSGLTE